MNKYQLVLIVSSLIIFGVGMRLLPHAPNFTPVTALALVGGLYIGKRWALLIPSIVLICSDAIIGFYDWKILMSVYVSFVLIGLLSMAVSQKRSVVAIGIVPVISSVLFFLLTNTVVWAYSPWYEKSFAGLLYAYELGLPFLRNMFVGDILYSIALCSLFEVSLFLYRSRHQVPNLKQVVGVCVSRVTVAKYPMLH